MANSETKVGIIVLGGKQHLVSPGKKLVANRVSSEVGSELKVKDVLSNEDVVLKVIAHTLGKKVNGLKFHSKVRYTRRYGHRQQQTVFEVIGVGKKAESVKVEKKSAKTTAKPKAKTISKKSTTSKKI